MQNANSDTSDSSRYVRDVQVAELLDVSRATVWRLVKSGDLPPPYKLRGSTRFKLCEIVEAIEKGRA